MFLFFVISGFGGETIPIAGHKYLQFIFLGYLINYNNT